MCNVWVWLVGVVSRKRVRLTKWERVESMGVVERRYIDFHILFISTPLVTVLFCSSIPTFCNFFNVSRFCYTLLYVKGG